MAMHAVESDRRRIAIIGAGPIGLEAALHAVQAGFSVQVYERGRIAENVLDWGHVRLFSPFSRNSSPLGRQAVREQLGRPLPADDALLTGRHFAEQYVLPLSTLPCLSGCIHEQTAVLAVGRSRFSKREQIGKPERASDPFQLLVMKEGHERREFADVVLDCSGVYPYHNWIGAGGLPCFGETEALSKDDYRLPDIAGTERARFAGGRTLVVGSGYSAATAVVDLAEVGRGDENTSVVWLTRSPQRPPIDRISRDPLRERDRLAEEANRLALSADSVVDWRPGTIVHRVTRSASDGVFHVELCPPSRDISQQQTLETLTVDNIIANVGYRPDRSLYEELQVHECYASQGPMNLAAALLGETSSDCLHQSTYGVETLRTPEPDFFILGAKSYGRDSRFLISIGMQQIHEVLRSISPKAAAVVRGTLAGTY